MLGWEFPPHISGGLGTACYGLTQGLREHDVHVDFVVPRVFGDEDQRYVELLSCESTLQARQASGRDHVVSASMAASHQHEPQPTTFDRARRWLVASHETNLTQIGIDSPLHPYLDADTYERRLHEISGHADSAAVFGHTLGQENATLRRGDGAVPVHGQSEARVEVEKSAAPLFSGKYGRDLMDEVYRYASAVEEIAGQRVVDVIHAHDWMTYPAAVVAKEISKKPLVVHLHASEFDRSGEHPNPQIREIEARGFEAADLIICVSHYTASILHRRYMVSRAKLRVVHNAVVHVPKAIQTQARTISEPIVLFLGRITFQKGPEYFLHAAALVIAHEPQAKFVMAGDGDMLRAMIELAARLGISRNIHFTGFLRGKEVERMYAMADLYIMPSVSEPFGIAPLEAMSLDVPVIVSRQSGVSEILQHALKIDFWDVEELANKILSILRQPALRNSLIRGGREELRHVQWSHRAEKVLSIYQEAIA
jgi:glycosyltransferase involved in cell wall biosynthesis